MATAAEAWFQGLRRFGILNAPVELISTAIVGIVLYSLLVLTFRPPVLSQLAVILNSSSRPAMRKIASYLPASTRAK